MFQNLLFSFFETKKVIKYLQQFHITQDFLRM